MRYGIQGLRGHKKESEVALWFRIPIYLVSVLADYGLMSLAW